MDASAILFHLVSAGLVLGLAGALLGQQPAERMARPLWAFLSLSMLYIVGDALTQLSDRLAASLFWEQVGIALLYTGAIGGATACWLMPIRFADVHQCRPAWLGPLWVRIPVIFSVVAWIVMITNPWHGRFIVPVVGALNGYTTLWHLLVWPGYAQVAGSILLFGLLTKAGPDPSVRRNAAIMGGGVLALLLSNVFYYEWMRTRFGDTSVLGLGAASLFFLYGSYRARIFSLLPVGLAAAQQHDPEGLLVVSPEGRLLHANPAGLAVLGLDEEGPGRDVFGRLAERLRDSSGRPLDARRLRTRLERAGPLAQGVRLTDGDRFFRVQMTPIPSRRGEILALLLRFVDITELRRIREALEETIEERTAELRASEERYRMVSELSSDGSFSIRVLQDGSIEGEWITPAMTQLTGLSLEDFAGKPWETGVHPEDRERVARALTRSGEAPGPVEFRMLRRSRKPRWLVLEAGVADRFPDGSQRVVGAVRDIHERKREEAERLRFEQRSQEIQRLESLGNLAGGIAHDFNNAMAIVLGNTELASEDAGPESLVARRLDRVRAAARHAADLTEQLLTYAGRSKPHIRSLHLGQLLADMGPLLDVSARGAARIRIEPEDEPLFLEGEATQIRQVVLNLVSNARESYGGARGPVSVRTGRTTLGREALAAADVSWAEPDDEYVYLEVSDQGSGISEDVRRRMFDPFATTKFVGRGLGLAVVIAIVRSHRGAIAVASSPGDGTTFRVFFPSTGAPVRSPGPRATAPPAARHDASVLVVDDDEAVRELAQILLTRAGFRVREAASGREALEILLERREPFDVVLLDLAMPEVDGREVLESLQTERPELPVILTSGYDHLAVERRLDGDPGVSFLQKPYGAEDLVERVLKATGDRREPPPSDRRRVP